MTANRGVKKVSERILADGRAIIVTEKDKDKYNWDEIPPGSKFIDTATGIEWVKLKDVLIDKSTGMSIGYGVINDGDGLIYRHDGQPLLKPDGVTQYSAADVELSEQTGWVPAHVRNDGTICIAKDSIIIEEVFTIFKPDDGEGNMEYLNTEGQHRRFPIMSDGSCVIELEKGSYLKMRNHLEVFFDDTVRKDTVTGGVKELTEKRIALTDPLSAGQKITVRYILLFRYGNPYPRIFYDNDKPTAAEIGDLWIDLDDYINTDIGVSIDKTILSDEPLDGGFQPKESGGEPDDIRTGDN